MLSSKTNMFYMKRKPSPLDDIKKLDAADKSNPEIIVGHGQLQVEKKTGTKKGVSHTPKEVSKPASRANSQAADGEEEQQRNNPTIERIFDRDESVQFNYQDGADYNIAQSVNELTTVHNQNSNVDI